MLFFLLLLLPLLLPLSCVCVCVYVHLVDQPITTYTNNTPILSITQIH